MYLNAGIFRILVNTEMSECGWVLLLGFFLLFAGITATANEAETLNKAIASSSQKQQAIRKDIYPRVKVQHHVKKLCMFYLFFKLI